MSSLISSVRANGDIAATISRTTETLPANLFIFIAELPLGGRHHRCLDFVAPHAGTRRKRPALQCCLADCSSCHSSFTLQLFAFITFLISILRLVSRKPSGLTDLCIQQTSDRCAGGRRYFGQVHLQQIALYFSRDFRRINGSRKLISKRECARGRRYIFRNAGPAGRGASHNPQTLRLRAQFQVPRTMSSDTYVVLPSNLDSQGLVF